MIQGFLPKPFGPQQLMAAVDRALSGWGLPSAD
jgi:FixJ family two-component response regulator